ncbi:hypothetical protein [Candidatus Pantoea persica]|uniref:hypothetical protein n=1 Tax=Candidatus Pantoea persica TaxID=2518128 RepID=UPI00215DB6C3|nr:hypothetical protein [Candidatus Pantoea persica]MBA2814677.1 hypothetical protein [Candidatus Pantoea persica]
MALSRQTQICAVAPRLALAPPTAWRFGVNREEASARRDGIQNSMRQGGDKEQEAAGLAYVEKVDDTVENYWLSV